MDLERDNQAAMNHPTPQGRKAKSSFYQKETDSMNMNNPQSSTTRQPVDLDALKRELEHAITSVQLIIEDTEEPDTRTRSIEVLKILQRSVERLEGKG